MILLLLKKKYTYSLYVSVFKSLSIDDVGMSRDTAFQEMIRPGAGFETGDFVKERLGGLP